MKKVKMVLSWYIPMVLITVALMTPAIAQAGSIKIWPDQLIPREPNSDAYLQDVSSVRNGSFYAPLTLPKGATITKITFYHLGVSSPASTQLDIYRTNIADTPVRLGYGFTTDSTNAIIPVDVVLTGDPIIRGGYRYYIRATSSNEDSHFRGVKIYYLE